MMILLLTLLTLLSGYTVSVSPDSHIIPENHTSLQHPNSVQKETLYADMNRESGSHRKPAASVFPAFIPQQKPEQRQILIKGTVLDAETGETLPAANIQIMDTYRGTITNHDGYFELPVDSLPVTLIIRYIGYSIQNITVEMPGQPLQIRMQPSVLEMQEVVITEEDPALGIMERVILRKQLWRQNLETYTTQAYTRQRLENDEGIVSISESVSKVHWDRDRGTREVVLSRRQTNNLAESQNFAGAGYLPNLYDDNIDIAGYRMVGVTHPDALKYYDFKLENLRNIDEQLIYDIRVIPKRRLQPVFEGMVSVLAGEYAMIEVDLKPGPAVMFPAPVNEINLHYRQQFSNFSGEPWLPVDMRIEGFIDIGFIGLQFPTIRFSQISSLTDYRINVPLPDSLYRVERKLVVDTLSTKSGKSLEELGQPLPLDAAEKTAYEEVDSTKSLEDAFRPTGFLANLITTDDEDENQGGRSLFGRLTSRFEPVLWYNRVDALHAGAKYSSPAWKGLRADASLGYSLGSEDWGYGTGLSLTLPYQPGSWYGRTRFESGYKNNTTNIGGKSTYPMGVTGILPLFGARDYFDYFRNEQAWFSIEQSVRPLRSTLTLRMNHEKHSSVVKNTSFSIPGGHIQPDNPVIEDGTLNSAEIRFRLGENSSPLGIAGRNAIQVIVEHSSPGLAGSDFEFTSWRAEADIRIPTFFRRRFIPNTMDVRLMAGTFTGSMPVQRMVSIDGSLGLFRPFGTLRSLTNRPLMASDYAFAFWEHNFRTIPFEILGMYGLARRGIGIVIHGASGHIWQNGQSPGLRYAPDDGFYHEAGLSVNGIFGIFRLDATMRLDQPVFTAGIGFARFF
jgi:opacity protein-like surface antigen